MTTAQTTTKYQAYPKYKPSGIDWLGDIPDGWDVKKLKYTVKELVGGGTPDTGNDQNWTDGENGTPWVNIADMTSTFIIQETEKKVTSEGLMEKNLRILPKKTLLYSMYASLGKVALLDIDAVTNQAILGVVEDKHKAISNFIKWWLISIEPYLSLFSSNSTQNNLNEFKVKNMPVFLPSLPQQQVIADFLDRETAKIDEVMAKKQKLIDLLLEKRQAIISHAVTKGLNLRERTKESEIPWLGSILARWKVVKIKDLVLHRKGSIKTGPFGSDLTTSDYVYDENVIFAKVYTQENVIAEDFEIGDSFIDRNKYQELETCTLYPGDIVLTTRGTLGKCVIFPQSAKLGVMHPCLLRLQLNDKIILRDFF